MVSLKCKMCGGNLNIEEGSSICECEYCGSKQTVPNIDDDKKAKLFERAYKLRYNCEFDKAAGVYENIVSEYPDEAEGYWGLLLCRYGIEYVDDPANGKKVPTCHRSSFDSIMDDADFEMVMENSDSVSRSLYRDEAKCIEELRKGIIEVSGKEKPYDIFICYKETDENGERTLDSVLAQDVYDELTRKGYRVFFSRISLEDKLGVEYEPYIFAALNSAKIMLAFGTSYDYYNAVWVKNEWSRFIKLMAKDKSKTLIPCFKGIDAYDIPKEFAKFQAQDMGKVGAVQDLVRGIQKILTVEKSTPTPIAHTGGPNTEALMKRGYFALEDKNWEQAKSFFNQVLNMDAENPDAYLGLALSEIGLCKFEDVLRIADSNFINTYIVGNRNYQRALSFLNQEKKEIYTSTLNQAIDRARQYEAEQERKRQEELRIAEENRRIAEEIRLEEERKKEEARHLEIQRKNEEEERKTKQVNSIIVKINTFINQYENSIIDFEFIKNNSDEIKNIIEDVRKNPDLITRIHAVKPYIATFCVIGGTSFGRFSKGLFNKPNQ